MMANWMKQSVFIKTFGCAANTADSERIRAHYWQKGWVEVKNWKEADLVVINSCVVRESAENRVYGLINLIDKYRQEKRVKIEIGVTGCLIGWKARQKNLGGLRANFPQVKYFWPIEKLTGDLGPIRDKKKAALIPISSGCNNFCSYCIVPFSRGSEISRPEGEILGEIERAIDDGWKEVVLIGQNVNSYGADFEDSTWVHLGKKRLKSHFPKLLAMAAKTGIGKISFVSSNPWDFSDELIEVIAKNDNIDRLIHLPFQAGSDEVLRRMNRGYTKQEYLDLVEKIKKKVVGVKFSTDVIVGFPGESEEDFEKTVEVCKKVGFEIAYLNKYSPRRGTVSAKLYKDDVPMVEKKRRWRVLEDLINVNR